VLVFICVTDSYIIGFLYNFTKEENYYYYYYYYYYYHYYLRFCCRYNSKYIAEILWISE